MKVNNLIVIVLLLIIIILIINYYKKKISYEGYENKNENKNENENKEKKTHMDNYILNFLRKKIGNFNTLQNKKSPHQNIEIIQFEKNDKGFNKCMVLDGEPQLCDNDEHEYHELIVHYPASFFNKIENVLIIGGGDCMTLREVMRYNTIKNVYMLELDQDVVNISKKYFNSSDYENDERVKIIYGDASFYIDILKDNYFDLVIIDTTEDGSNNSPIDKYDFFKKCKNKLKKNGIFVKNGDTSNNIISASKLYKNTALFEIKEINFLGRYPFIIASDNYKFVNQNNKNKETERIVNDNEVYYFQLDKNYLI
tara:strand:+ start:180 stop:1112 length:933 start_codon:yes stop_codon:yes gene_type:complete